MSAAPDKSVPKPAGRLLYVAVNLNPPGGGQCVGAWALQALRRDWKITVLCSNPPDFAALNRHFGTTLDAGEFTICKAPWLIRESHRFDPDVNSFQRAAWLMRMARRMGGAFDVILGTDNEMDFGHRGIQYVHYPYLVRHKPEVEAVRNLSRLGRIGAFFRGRYRPWMLTSGITFEGVESNLTLVNSHWTAALADRLYNIESRVLYPPVAWPAHTMPWEQREAAFVSLGRIEPVKRQLEAIEILEAVRRRGFEVSLEIIGDIADPQYARELGERARTAGPWVRLHHGISRGELESIVNRCRFGLHTMLAEHFGIAVAELVRAGCIVFVPDSGGQVEIIGHEAGLTYSSDDVAIERICRVLDNEAEQSRLREFLARRRDLFSEQRFMQEISALVRDFAVEQAR